MPSTMHGSRNRSDLDVPLAIRVREVRRDVRARLGTDVMVPDRVHAMRLPIHPRSHRGARTLPGGCMDARREPAGDARRCPDVGWPVQQTSSSRCCAIGGNHRATHPRRSCNGSGLSACRCIWTDRPFQGADPPVGAPGRSRKDANAPIACRDDAARACVMEQMDDRSWLPPDVAVPVRRALGHRFTSRADSAISGRQASVGRRDTATRRQRPFVRTSMPWRVVRTVPAPAVDVSPGVMASVVAPESTDRHMGKAITQHAAGDIATRCPIPCDIRPFANEHHGWPRSPMPDGSGRVNTHG